VSPQLADPRRDARNGRDGPCRAWATLRFRNDVHPTIVAVSLSVCALACWREAGSAVIRSLRAHATVMGYADCFALLGVVLLAAIIPVVLLRKGPGAGGTAH
jgi:hypothetical protein